MGGWPVYRIFWPNADGLDAVSAQHSMSLAQDDPAPSPCHPNQRPTVWPRAAPLVCARTQNKNANGHRFQARKAGTKPEMTKNAAFGITGRVGPCPQLCKGTLVGFLKRARLSGQRSATHQTKRSGGRAQFQILHDATTPVR